jgi:hypothetical protein
MAHCHKYCDDYGKHDNCRHYYHHHQHRQQWKPGSNDKHDYDKHTYIVRPEQYALYRRIRRFSAMAQIIPVW